MNPKKSLEHITKEARILAKFGQGRGHQPNFNIFPIISVSQTGAGVIRSRNVKTISKEIKTFHKENILPKIIEMRSTEVKMATPRNMTNRS